MEFVTFSDPFVEAAFWVGVSSIVIVLLLFLYISLLRLANLLKQKRKEAIEEVWTPVFLNAIYELPEELPTLKKNQTLCFLQLWNHYYELLGGDARVRLESIVNRMDLEGTLRQLVKSGGISKQLLAVNTLGNLRVEGAWDDIVGAVQDENPVLSLVAAKALLKIHAKRAVDVLLPFVFQRDDWTQKSIFNLFKTAGKEVFDAPFVRELIQKADIRVAKVIQLLQTVSKSSVSPILRSVLKRNPDEKIVTECLMCLNSPADLDIARKYLESERWHVRVHAATALGRLGTHGDEKLLVNMLSDKEWWVRYRAAQALASLTFITTENLYRFREEVSDKFAKDILDQVIFETQVMK